MNPFLYTICMIWLTILAYFDIKNDRNVPKFLFLDFLLIVLIGMLGYALITGNQSFLVDKPIMMLIGIESLVLMHFGWGEGDALALVGIALLTPQIALLVPLYALLPAFSLWIVKKREKPIPFIPFILIGYLVSGFVSLLL